MLHIHCTFLSQDMTGVCQHSSATLFVLYTLSSHHMLTHALRQRPYVAPDLHFISLGLAVGINSLGFDYPDSVSEDEIIAKGKHCGCYNCAYVFIC